MVGVPKGNAWFDYIQEGRNGNEETPVAQREGHTVLGQEVAVLLDGAGEAGYHTAEFEYLAFQKGRSL